MNKKISYLPRPQKYMFIVLSLFLFSGLSAQTLKFKMERQGDHYEGKMSPRWYQKVNLRLLEEGTMLGAHGTLTGGKLDALDLLIAENKLGTPEEYMVRTNNGWYPLLDVKFTGNKLSYSFQWDFRVKPTAVDLAVLKRTNVLLETEAHWETEDDRVCESDVENQKYSLFCALKQASLDETGDFNHRSAALEIVRENISLLQPGRAYKHQLMEFNNNQTFEQIKEVLFICINKMADQLASN